MEDVILVHRIDELDWEILEPSQRYSLAMPVIRISKSELVKHLTNYLMDKTAGQIFYSGLSWILTYWLQFNHDSFEVWFDEDSSSTNGFRFSTGSIIPELKYLYFNVVTAPKQEQDLLSLIPF